MIILPTGRAMPLKPAVIKDPYYSSVSMLLHMDGPNGSTTFTDYGPNTLAITPYYAQISSSQSIFGGTSGYFAGVNINLSTPSTNAFAFGSGDYTVECWMYETNTNLSFNLFAFSDNQDNVNLNWNGAGTLSYNNGSSNGYPSILPNVWYHIALVRRNGVVRVYVNGVVTLSQATTPVTNSARSLYVGGNPAVFSCFRGYIDEFRVTKGVARYTSNFSVPTKAFPNS